MLAVRGGLFSSVPLRPGSHHDDLLTLQWLWDSAFSWPEGLRRPSHGRPLEVSAPRVSVCQTLAYVTLLGPLPKALPPVLNRVSERGSGLCQRGDGFPAGAHAWHLERGWPW